MFYLGLQLLSALVLLGVLALSGEALARFLPPGQSALGRICDRVAVGAFIWMVLLFTLATFGLYRRPVLLIMAAVLSAGGMAVAWRGQGDEASAPSELDAVAEGSGWPAAALFAATGSVLAVLALQALRPNISWDANVYHLALPRLFLESGRFVAQEMLVYSHWPMGVDLLYGLAMAVNGYITAKLLHFTFGVLTLFATARLARMGGVAAPSGLLAAGLVLINQVVQYEIRVAYVDLAYAFFLATSMLHLLRGLEHHREAPSSAAGRRELLLAGLSAAAMVSCKLNGFFGLAALCLVGGAGLISNTRRDVVTGPRAAKELLARVALPLCGPSIAVGALWAGKSLMLTGNPTYPLFHAVFGGADWSAALGEQHAAWQRSMGMGRALTDYLLLPIRVILNGDYGYANFDGKVHWLWIVAVPVAVAAAIRDRQTRALLLASALLFVLWAFTSQQTRFLIPILPLLAAATARAIDLAATAVRVRGPVHFVVSSALAIALIQSSWIYIEQTQRLGRDLVRYGADIERAVVHPVYPWIDNNLPQEAKLLLVNTNHGFYVRRTYIADSFFEASQIADATRDMETATEVADWFAERGVSHLLIERRERGIRFSSGFLRAVEDSGLVFRSQDDRFEVRALYATPIRNASASAAPGSTP